MTGAGARHRRSVCSSRPSPSSARSSFTACVTATHCSTVTCSGAAHSPGASVVATLYSVAFGGFLLSLVLWDQNVWHWSALHTGLAIAPGPFLVLPTALLLAERLIVRFGSGVVIAIGATLFASALSGAPCSPG